MVDLSARPAGHLAPLDLADDWAIWRWSCLRSTGFPVGRLALLADPDAVTAADELNGLRAECDQKHDDALAAIRSCLDELSQAGQWDSPYRKPLLKAISTVRKGRDVTADLPAPAQKATAALRELRERVRTAEGRYADVWSAAARRTSRAIAEIVADDRFAEAIIWQNREGYHTVVRPLRRDGDGGVHNQVRRRREEFVARYLQRYCAKNDTIGFFGPIAWATFADGGPSMAVRCGRGLIAARRLYVEQWGADLLVDAIGALPGARRWGRPRRLPFAHFTADAVFSPGVGTLPLSAGQSALLARCSGRRTAAELAAEAVSWGDPELTVDGDVYDFLADMSDRGVLEWRLELPFRTDPHRELDALIAQITDDQLHATARRMLRLYEKAIDGVAEAAGDAEALDRGMERLDTVFTRLTGEPPSRRSGEMYAGRSLVYEDCVRDIDLRIGPDVLAELGRPLSVILRSLRWYTSVVAAEAIRRLRGLYDRLSGAHGGQAVPVALLWEALPELIPSLGNDRNEPTEFIERLCRDFRTRWRDLVDVDPDARVMQLRSEDLQGRAAAAFPAARPGWAHARYHSPDILLAATDAEAVARGEYQLVLGEVHVANNTLLISRFVDNHPTPEAVPQFVAADLPERLVAPVTPRDWRGVTSSTRYALPCEDDLHLLMTHEPVDPAIPDRNRVPIAELIVEDVGGELRARSYDRSVDVGVLDLIGDLLSVGVVDSFSLLGPEPHTPRICLDRLVIQREGWRVPLGEIAELIEGDDARRFAAFRGFAAARGMPDRVFLSTPTEDKPVLLDFTSPILVNVVAKTLRRAVEAGAPDDTITMTEMLPGPSQSWLTDHEGNRYTSEFRTVVVDTTDHHAPTR